jgi:hypothetical protein
MISNEHTLTVRDQIHIRGSGILTGSGVVEGMIRNGGTVSLGSTSANSTDALTISGYRQDRTGILAIEIVSAQDHGALDVRGIADLAGGALDLQVSGQPPSLGETLTVLNAMQVEGDFDIVNGIDLQDQTGLAVTYGSDRVTATRALLGDANLDGTVNAADLNDLGLSWLGNQATWSTGDFTGDGTVNAQDLNKLALNWQQSVPQVASVPEPSSTILSIVLVFCGLPLLRTTYCTSLSCVTVLN